MKVRSVNDIMTNHACNVDTGHNDEASCPTIASSLTDPIPFTQSAQEQ